MNSDTLQVRIVQNPESPPGSAIGSDEARDAVSAIVEKADQRQQERAEVEATHEAAGPKKPFFARPAVAVTLMVAFAAILATNVYVLTRPTAPPTALEIESVARMETAAVALQIEAYKQEHGRYPASLSDAGIELIGVEYTRSAEGYVLQAKAEGTAVTHRADQDPEDLLSVLVPAGDVE